MSRAARRRAFRRGHVAEFLCLWHLRLRGWRIPARRFKVKSGEIDLIARRGRVLAAIEVKARDSLSAASEADLGASAPPHRPRARSFPGAPSGAAASRRALRRDAGGARRLPRHLVDAWCEAF